MAFAFKNDPGYAESSDLQVWDLLDLATVFTIIVMNSTTDLFGDNWSKVGSKMVKS